MGLHIPFVGQHQKPQSQVAMNPFCLHRLKIHWAQVLSLGIRIIVEEELKPGSNTMHLILYQNLNNHLSLLVGFHRQPYIQMDIIENRLRMLLKHHYQGLYYH